MHDVDPPDESLTRPTDPAGPLQPGNPNIPGPGAAVVSPVAAGGGSGAVVVDRGVRKRAGGLIDPFGLRMLVITWCLWLLVSWSITLAMGATVHAVRWVVFSAVFGLMAVWPAVRLSQQLPWWRGEVGAGGRPGVARDDGAGDIQIARARPSMRVLGTLLDWMCLVSVFQVVIWPLMLVGRWSPQQTLWLDMAVISWSLLTGVLVGLGRVLPVAGARVGAMVLCVLLLLGEPVLMAFGGGFADAAASGISGAGGWRMRVSPVQALWELTTTVQPYNPSGWAPVILSTAVAAVLGWLVLWAMAWRTR